MRTNLSSNRFASVRADQRGSATLVMFIMLSIMVTFVISNSLTMHHLKREVRLIEERQLRKYEPADAAHLDRVNKSEPRPKAAERHHDSQRGR